MRAKLNIYVFISITRPISLIVNPGSLICQVVGISSLTSNLLDIQVIMFELFTVPNYIIY